MLKLLTEASVHLQRFSYMFTFLFLLIGSMPAYAISWGIFQNDTTAYLHQVEGANQLVKTNPDSVLTLSDEISQANQKLLIKSKGSVQLKAEVLCLHGRALRYKGELSLAETYLDSALVIFKSINNAEGIAKSSHELGTVYFYFGEYDVASGYCTRACEIRDSIGLYGDLSVSLTTLGIIYSRLSLIDSAEYFHQKSLSIREGLNDTSGIIASLNSLGNINLLRSDFDASLAIYMEALSISDTTDSNRRLASLYNNIGFIHRNQANYSEALRYFHLAHSCYEKINDLQGAADVLLNIGGVNFDIGIFDHAHRYTSQALSTYMLAENNQGIADSYFQMGRIYQEEKKFGRAQRFFNYALELKVEVNDKRGIGDCYQNLAVVYQDLSQLDSAEYNFDFALNIYESIDYIYGIATVSNNLARLYIESGRTNECISAANKSLKYSLSYDGFVDQIDSYNFLAKAYELIGFNKTALTYFKRAYKIKDSIFDTNTTKSIVEMEVRYQSRNLQRAMEKQELMLSKREAEIVSNQREYTLQRRIRNILIISSLFLVLLLLWNFRVLVSKKQNNKQLRTQKEDIVNKNVELAKLNGELHLQRSQIELQHHELIQQKEASELINFHFERGIKYANYIQQAILPSKTKLNEILGEYFVFYKPKEVVGGDFYYVTVIANYKLIAVGDCTGHGVPGGFLTMLGMSLLKSLINKHTIHDPANILNQLRSEMIETFEQTGQLLEQTDGIDIAITVIDDAKNELLFSGGRGNAIITGGKESPKLIKGDRIAVSFTPKMRDFTTQKISLLGDENIYLYTDGYTDQFNANNMKFGRKQFVSLCEQECNKPFVVQKNNFETSFEHWRNDIEQIDDALVFAFKVK